MGEQDRGRPTGTVSFLFTDIEGSTPLWEQHPEAMRAALERHDAILREAIEGHGGFVFSTAGDAFSAAFHTPGDAVRAALDAQRGLRAEPWPDETLVKVRMGVHLGTVEERDGDYFGSAVNRSARLMGLAHGGQVLVSLAVEELVRDDLADGVGLVGLGEHSLKGLSRPETIFQLTASDLLDEFPPLAAATSVPGNLPSPPTSFVGRVQETKRLAGEIPSHRLVTLVGPGGVGKTRLSIEAAAAVVDDFPDGVWFVELAPIADADAVVHAVASTLSVSPEAGSSLLESIVDSLAGRRVLVVLDNCEHVIDAAAEIAAAVGAGALKTTILASSREPLGVAGEQLWNVSVLDVAVEAVELFCERARSVDQGFGPSEVDLALIGGICERLDGMPLAIELAASRVRSMSLAQLADRLADRFKLLRSSARGGIVERHQTLRAAVEWSYQLLGPDEQALFDRLSVFAGGFDLDATEAVCGFDPIDELDVFDLLGSLVDKSLVVVDRDTGRYRLLETLRQYGVERLEARGEVDGLRGRHLGHFVEVAGRARGWFEGSRNADGRELFEVEWDNLRAALEWAEATGEDQIADRLVRDPFWYAFFAAREEHDRWAQRRVEAGGSGDPEVLGLAGNWRWLLGDYELGEQLARRGVDAAPTPDHPTAAIGWNAVTQVSWYSKSPEAARAADLAAKGAVADSSDIFTTAFVTGFAHTNAAFDPEQGPRDIASARALVDGLANDTIESILAYHSGFAAFGLGRYEQALAEWRRAAELAARARNRPVEGAALAILTVRALTLGSDDQVSLFRDALDRLHTLGLHSLVFWAMTGLADWWTRHDLIHQAGRIIGFLDRNDPVGYQSFADLRAHATQAVDAHPDASTWRAEGAAMTRDEIVAWCLERLDVD